ncbi:uncharacterized protein PV07_00888 [Cladophialophora immunda]|uniref:Uncharacterized protein n=1 Tax=Cladophialophora immunda TaxID=569365 RepID=A0A0D2DEI3_9EURO|nr:uncharacterized protein PV07_00888 [Cladophialophora immunda]KIW34089.1 hypothetical protein PV07_00888 [Cladophialophora immunda]
MDTGRRNAALLHLGLQGTDGQTARRNTVYSERLSASAPTKSAYVPPIEAMIGETTSRTKTIAALMQSGGPDQTPIHAALRVMASQVSRQSTTYAKTLRENLEPGQLTGDLLEFWTRLKFEDFPAPPHSVLYLFFDNLHRLQGDFRELSDFLRSVAQGRCRTRTGDNNLCLKVILTGKEDAWNKLEVEMPKLNVAELNLPLLRDFIVTQMRMLKILQDKGEEYALCKERLIQQILKSARGSFVTAMLGTKIAQDAVDEDLDADELLQRINDEANTSPPSEGASILRELAGKLSVLHQEQLIECLIWAFYGEHAVNLALLESALFLQHQRQSLEPLRRKINTRFERALKVLAGGLVVPSKEVEEYIHECSIASEPETKPSKSGVHMKAEHGEDLEVHKQLLTNSKGALADGTSGSTGRAPEIGESRAVSLNFSQTNAHFTICMRCLKALNDDTVRDKARPLIEYAATALPYHLRLLSEKENISKLCPSERRTIAQGLIEFLSDYDCVNSAWLIQPFSGSEWLRETKTVVAIRGLLTHDLILHELEPRDRRWALKNTQHVDGKPPYFLGRMATIAASQWLEDHGPDQAPAHECFDFVDMYLDIFEPPALLSEFNGRDNGRGPSGSSKLSSISRSRSSPPALLTSQHQTSPPKQGAMDAKSKSSTQATGSSIRKDSERRSKYFITHFMGAEVNQEIRETEKLKDHKPSPKQRVERAKEWALYHLDIDLDDFVFRRLSNTIFRYDKASAIGYLQIAQSCDKSQDRFGTTVELASAYYLSFQFQKAFDTVGPIIDELQNQRKNNLLTRATEAHLCVALLVRSHCFFMMEKQKDAIELMEESLQICPSQSAVRYQLVIQLCCTGEPQDAQRAREIFTEWIMLADSNVDNGPGPYFLAVAHKNPVLLAGLILSAKDPDMHDLVMGVLRECVHEAIVSENLDDQRLLQFLQGLGYRSSTDEEEKALAVELWQSSVARSRKVGPAEDFIACWSSHLAAQFCVDKALEDFRRPRDWSEQQKKTLLAALDGKVRNLLLPKHETMGVYYTPMAFVAAFAKLLGLKEESQKILKEDMANALEILSDNDAENDQAGLEQLFEILRCCGDFEGASSAWSFFDRRPKNAESQTLGTESESRTTYHYRTMCDNCGDDMKSCERKEIWRCNYCPDQAFCGDCMDVVKATSKGFFDCGQHHDFTLFQHFDYDEEEIRNSNVRVDWKLDRGPDGRGQRREGGRIVDLRKWVEILRKDWDIPETSLGGRVQK